MGASCSTAASTSTKTSRQSSMRRASGELKPANHTPARTLPEAAKVKLVATAHSQQGSAVQKADTIATAPQCDPKQTKDPEPKPAAKEPEPCTDHQAPAADPTPQPGAKADEHAVSEAKFDTLLEQERAKRTRRRSAVGGAAGDFGGQLDEAMGAGDIHPDVLAMMKEAEAAHRAAGLEPLKPQALVPAAAEPKAVAAAAVAAATAATAAVAGVAASEVKKHDEPSKPETLVAPPTEPQANSAGEAKQGDAPAAPAAAAEPASAKVAEPVSAEKPAEPVPAAAAAVAEEKAPRDYQRGKTGVTSIHSTASGASDQSELDGDNMAEALHDEVSATAMQQAPDSCDNALEVSNETDNALEVCNETDNALEACNETDNALEVCNEAPEE